MEDIAGWVAPAATMIAAMMTAANLGPRITGYGFIVFLIGSIAWCAVAIATGQQNLLLTNAFLSLVNLVGIWRWLGRQSRYHSGAEAAERKSEERPTPALFRATLFDGQAVTGAEGTTIAQSVGAMIEQESGRLSYVVVSEGGIGGVGERLHRIEWDEIAVRDGSLTTELDAEALKRKPELEPTDWPA